MAKLENNSDNLQSLLPIHGEGSKQTVSAKDLYLFLGLDPKKWTRWYRLNIINNKFAIEGEDWNYISSKGNRVDSQDFEITVDMGKRFSMMARTEKGETARSYFIECERKVLNPVQLTDEQIIAKGYLLAVAKNEQLSIENTALKTELIVVIPKAEAFDDAFNDKDYDETLTAVAGLRDISATRLVNILIERNVFRKEDRKPHLKYQTESKWFKIMPQKTNGKKFDQIFVTPAGQKAILLILSAPEHRPLFPSIAHGEQKRLLN